MSEVEIGNQYPTTATVGISENGYAGTFNVTSTCASIATLSISSQAGPSATVTVTQKPNASTSTCVATITDSFGQTADLKIDSTSIAIGIQ